MNFQQAIQLYRTMFLIRYVEDRIAQEYQKGYMRCPVHLYVGQEAIASGICAHLQKTDFVSSNHRSHGHYLAKGGSLRLLFNEICCLSTGCAKGWGGSQHIYAPEIGIMGTSAILGGGLAVGTGLAYGLKMKNQSGISAVFFGDGATEEGYFYESLNFAGLKKLPVLYICENNGLATHSRIQNRRSVNTEIFNIANSLGVYALKIDGNDAIAVFDAGQELAERVRNNQPCLLEAITYRWKGHVTFEEDFGRGYRAKKEIEEWKEKCPIKRFAAAGLAMNLFTSNQKEAAEQSVITEVETELKDLESIVRDKKTDLIPKTPY